MSTFKKLHCICYTLHCPLCPRCYGETLSTLQFATRAKKIKNKAVVNEDTHGNTLQMQAEIRKLKEALAQFQSGAALTNQVKMEPGQFYTLAIYILLAVVRLQKYILSH